MQGCFLWPYLFNVFLERITSDALEEYNGKVRIGGRTIANLRCVDDKYALAKEELDLEAQGEIFNKNCTRFIMDISAERTNWPRDYKTFFTLNSSEHKNLSCS